MKELDLMADGLQEMLARKKENLLATGRLSLTAQGLLQNRAIEISSFKSSIKDVSSDPTLRSVIIRNFTKSASEIEDRIKAIN